MMKTFPGTSTGYRTEDGKMWFASEVNGKPAIVYCESPSNWVNPALYTLIAVFEKETDRDLVLKLHMSAVT